LPIRDHAPRRPLVTIDGDGLGEVEEESGVGIRGKVTGDAVAGDGAEAGRRRAVTVSVGESVSVSERYTRVLSAAPETERWAMVAVMELDCPAYSCSSLSLCAVDDDDDEGPR
jgi:hypothetical protein